LKVKGSCPICKASTKMRDLKGDDKMDRIASLFTQLEGRLSPHLAHPKVRGAC
jgi:hypothetical protein